MSQTVDFSQIKTINYDGVDISKLVLNGTRLWERYEIDEVYQEWVESGHDGKVIETVGLWYGKSSDRWTYLSGSSHLVQYQSDDYWTSQFPIIEINGGVFINTGFFFLERGDLYDVQNSYSRYKVRRVVVSDKWIDTSHNVEKTRKKTMYYY